MVYCILEVIVLARGPQRNRTGHPPRDGRLVWGKVDPTETWLDPKNSEAMFFFFWGGGGGNGGGNNLGLGVKSENYGIIFFGATNHECMLVLLCYFPWFGWLRWGWLVSWAKKSKLCMEILVKDDWAKKSHGLYTVMCFWLHRYHQTFQVPSKWRNPHLYKLYGYGLRKGKPSLKIVL